MDFSGVPPEVVAGARSLLASGSSKEAVALWATDEELREYTYFPFSSVVFVGEKTVSPTTRGQKTAEVHRLLKEASKKAEAEHDAQIALIQEWWAKRIQCLI